MVHKLGERGVILIVPNYTEFRGTVALLYQGYPWCEAKVVTVVGWPLQRDIVVNFNAFIWSAKTKTEFRKSLENFKFHLSGNPV